MANDRIVACIRPLRRRERLLATTWGAARWLVVVIGALFLACLLDFAIDRWRTTPGWLRSLLFMSQAALWLGAAAWFVARPLLRRTSDGAVAGWLEAWDARLDHRLVTAVELQRPRRNDEGTSGELVAEVTRQAEVGIADLAERVLTGQRLRWSAWGAGGVLAFLGLTCLFLPMPALVARQLLFDVAIPRQTHLANLNRDFWPSGEQVELRFAVTSRRSLGNGYVRIHPHGRPAEEYPLEAEPPNADSLAPLIYVAKVPASTADFRFDAWLGDGRLDQPGQVRFVARPAVGRIDAWTQLPGFCGERPDGKPYEQYQPRGDVAGLAGATVRVVIDVQKPVVTARLDCLDAQNVRKRTVPLVLDAEHRVASGSFDLRPNETAYRVVVIDEHDFGNADPPRRGLKIVPDESPHVLLLPEHFTTFVGQAISSDTEVEGKPVPLTPRGGKFRIAYQCQDAHGLARAQLTYRILPKDDPEKPGQWMHLPLREVTPGEGVGPFDARQGVFRNSGLDEQIEFHAEAAADPLASPGRLEGGGRFDFQIGALGLAPGDQLEYAIEVFDVNPDPQHSPGRSEIRRKRVVGPTELVEWLMHKAEHENRIRDLERKQREVRPGG